MYLNYVILTEEPHLLLVGGGLRVSKDRLAAVVQASKRQVRMATPKECEDIFGYAPGTFPPFAHRRKFPTIADR